MSAQAVQDEILAPMQAIYLPPRNVPEADQEKALRGYVGALQGFDAPDLKAAWETILAEHDKRSWPLPAQIVAAARLARKGNAPANAISEGEKRKAEAAQRWNTWVEVSHSELGREAARRDVSWSLKCLILHDGKRPEEIDLRALVIEKAQAERTADAIRSGQPINHRGKTLVFSGANAALAIAMWEGQQKNELTTQSEINYGTAA